MGIDLKLSRVKILLMVLLTALCLLGLLKNVKCYPMQTGESRPPTTLSHPHVRVLRDRDQRPSEYEEIPSGSDLGGKLLSPSYQHRVSHFHSIPLTQPEWISSRTSPYYPVAAFAARNGGGVDHTHSRRTTSPFYQDQGQGVVIVAEPQEPTFTPFIASRVLSNMPKFFQHLQENIAAIHDSDEIPDDSISVESAFLDLPIRRGDYFSRSDGRLSVDLGGQGQRPSVTANGDRTGMEASKDLLEYMGRDPKYKKANNYNPSWLFTNLGLGKRSG